MCWPFWSRREKLHTYAQSLTSYDSLLKEEGVDIPVQNGTARTFNLDNIYTKDKDIIDLNYIKIYIYKNLVI